jgi:hypothetical protein
MESTEKNEYVSIWVDKETKRNFEAMNGNKALQETLIKEFLLSEKGYMKEEMKAIDEMTIEYAAKLIKIKENFKVKHMTYVDEVNEIYTIADKKLKDIQQPVERLSKEVENSYQKVKSLFDKIQTLNIYPFEQMLNLIDRYNSMTDKDKEIFKIILNNKL